MGDFSKEAIEWIRMRKRLKKARKAQDDFLKRIRVNEPISQRTIMLCKLAGLKSGQYTPKDKKEEKLLKQLLERTQDVERGERERDLTKEINDGGSKSKSGSKGRDDRQR